MYITVIYMYRQKLAIRGMVADDNCFDKVLKKCQNMFACLFNKMLLIKQLRPCLNRQSDSFCSKVLVEAN